MTSSPIDLRSDTLTLPTKAMRQAMAHAPVGDDMFGEDPSIRALEARFCDITGKEAAVFVPSGTMANQLAIRIQTEPGDEIITHPDSHILHYESGAPAALAGVMPRYAHGPRGTFSPSKIRELVKPAGVHYCVTKLVTVENTHNRGGGSIWPVDLLQSVIETAHEYGLRVHIDGARIWNASIATGVPVRTIVGDADTVSACLSKGLGCPVGSLLAGDQPTITRARRFRKMFGGAMRQAGILAAAGLYALDTNIERLADDHANAQILAQRLASLPGVMIDPALIETNLVFFEIDPAFGSASEICEKLKSVGVLVLPGGPQRVRAVMHLGVSTHDAQQAAARIADVFDDLGTQR